MARKSISLDEKIEKAEAAVIVAKAKYDKALDELKVLVDKRKQLDDKKVLEAYHASDKSLEEIIAFLKTDGTEEDIDG
jgi:hypothetical protein